MVAAAPAERAPDRPVRPMGDGHPAVALAATVSTWSIAAAAMVLFLVERAPWSSVQWFFVVDLADAVVYGAVGWLLLARVRRAVAWIVAGCAFGGAVAAFAAQWSNFRETHPSAPRLEQLVTAQNWAWVPGTLALILVVPWLVRQGPLDVVGRVGVATGAIVTTAALLFRLTDPHPWPDGPSVMPLAIEDQWWHAHFESVNRWLFAATVVVGLTAAADVARRWIAQPPAARRGLGWLTLGAGVMSATFLPLALPSGWVDWLPTATTPVLHLVSQLFFPAALLVAVLGQQLWGLRLAFSRAVVWSLLTATLIAAYVLIVSLSSLVIPSLDDGVERLVAAALVAAIVDPVRRFVQRRVDRLVHGDAREPLLAMDRLGATLGSVHDPQRLLAALLEGMVDSLRLAGAKIDVTVARQPGVVTVGETVGHDGVSVPLVLDGELVGALTAWPRPGERLDQRTRRALDALVPTIAVAALLAVKAEELAESRARLVSARDEERRAIRRELHDGLGPALAGVGYGLGAARNLLRSDPNAADRLLARLAAEIDARVEEVRTLARELVPPVLLESGLAAALLELAERVRLSGLQVAADVDDRIEVAPDVAGPLYGIASEAVRNVIRHAAAAHVGITLRREGDAIHLEITDDGVGIGDEVAPGVGLQSMRERAGALDAGLTIGRRSAGGSVVTVRAPLRREVAS